MLKVFSWKLVFQISFPVAASRANACEAAETPYIIPLIINGLHCIWVVFFTLSAPPEAYSQANFSCETLAGFICVSVEKWLQSFPPL